MERFRKEGAGIGQDGEYELLDLLSELRRIQRDQPDRRREIILPLLDLSQIAVGHSPSAGWTSAPVDHSTQETRRSAVRLLELILGQSDSAELYSWLAESVLSQPRVHSLTRRLAAVQLLEGRYQPGTLLALFNCTTSDERELREAAVLALAGWEDENVSRFLATQMLRSLADRNWISMGALSKHFEQVTLDPESPAARELSRGLGLAAVDPEWRTAWRAIQALSAFDDALAVPPLVECLSTWVARATREAGSRRIEGAILKDLQRRSGRRIGAYPERWAAWWRAMQSGQIQAGGSDEANSKTSAGFFGLHPLTDRVVFVLDKSGSMVTPFSSGGTTATPARPTGNGGGNGTRYAEAARQLHDFLVELGPRTRFNVILFSDELYSWRSTLAPATPANVNAIGAWVRQYAPGGGTYLKPGIELALEVGPTGHPDLKHLEADTVIILCDGATAEGSAWVEDFLHRVNEEACVVFHSVQIGAGGDGTLELLAKESGGDYVQVK
jgi:VWA domain-containing protein